MKTLMILGGSILQVPAINRALEMGLKVVVVDMNPNAIGFTIPGVVKEVISTIDTPKVLAAAKKHRIDGIMTLASDMPMQTVAKVCSELDLCGVSEKTALLATNKAYMREALKDAQVPIPEFYRVNTFNEYLEAVSNIISNNLKCIVKPADNSGSRGIFLISTENDHRLAYDNAKHFSRGGELLVEEYMEGPEVSVETFAQNGKVSIIQITDKITTGPPHFVEMGHVQPSQLSEDLKNKINEVAINANHALGIVNGPSHTEIKCTSNGPKIVELGARLGGDCITTHLVPLSTGIDLVSACIKSALGEEVDLKPKHDAGAAIRYVDHPVGLFESISGTDAAKSIPGIVEISMNYKVGDELIPIESSSDRLGFVITKAVNAKEALFTAEQALNQIQIKVK